MYPNFTLYPGGAFTFCESVGEFDDNVQYPVPDEAPEKVVACIDVADPVIVAISHLTPVYENHIVPLMSMEYGFENVNDGIAKIETISTAMSCSVNALLKEIGSMTGTLRIARNSGGLDRIPFDAHRGFFMRNAAKVKQQGIETFMCRYGAIPAFIHKYEVGSLIDLMDRVPEVVDDIILSGTLIAVCPETLHRIADTFEGTIDMLKCVYKQSDRMLRLEEENNYRLTFNELIGTRDWECCDDKCNVYYSDNRYDAMSRRFFRCASRYLRDTAKECYDLQCKLVDGALDSMGFAEHVPALLARCINVFAIGTALMVHIGYDIREYRAVRAGIAEYTDLLLNTLKTV